ncbi:MFS transporter [Myxococcota bacterium]|nr:MFS transporter [Myxococcota bacterium]MBU1537953.1 MFS transporter [Myxococcota bacterium]
MAATVRLYYLFRGLSSAFLFKVFLVFYYLEQGLGFAHIGILQAIFAFTVIFLEIPTGIWADRYGRRKTMGYGALLMSLAAFGYYFAQGFYHFAFFEFLLAFGLSLTSGADSAFLYDALKSANKEELYSELEGKAGFAKHLGMALSALIGGFIAMRSLSALFPCTAVIIFLSYLVTFFMEQGLPVTTNVHQSAATHWRESLTALRNHRAIWWTILYSSLVFLMVRASDTLLQPVLKANGFEYWKIGILAAAGSLVAAFASKSTGTLLKRYNESFMLWMLPVILLISYALFASGSGILLGVVLLANLGIQGFYSPFTKTLLNRSIEKSQVRATLLSMESSVKRTVIALLMPLIGFVIDRYGMKGGLFTLVITGLICLVALFWATPGKLGGFGKLKTGYKGGSRTPLGESSVLNSGIPTRDLVEVDSQVCSATGKPAP